MTAAPNPIPTDALARASLDRLDAVASAMERKWGVDRLPKLVDANLSVRFHSQADRLNEVIRSDRHPAISVQAEAMIRAWGALDGAALEAGWSSLAPTVWETVLPETGEVIAIVRDQDEALAIAKERGGSVWTLAEVAIAIQEFGETVKATKRAFPGAQVTAVRPASLAIGSAPPVAGTEARTSPARTQPARSRRGRSAGVSSIHAPLFDPHSETPSKPPIDWSRGDDIPF